MPIKDQWAKGPLVCFFVHLFEEKSDIKRVSIDIELPSAQF